MNNLFYGADNEVNLQLISRFALVESFEIGELTIYNDSKKEIESIPFSEFEEYVNNNGIDVVFSGSPDVPFVTGVRYEYVSSNISQLMEERCLQDTSI